jgi:hypothetical protein
MVDGIDGEFGGLNSSLKEMDTLVKSLTKHVKDFSTALNGASKGPGARGVAGFGQLQLGNSGNSMMPASFGNIGQMLSANRSMNGWMSAAKGVTQIGAGILGGAAAGMPDVALTTARSSAFYDAAVIQGTSRNRIANATFGQMKGGLTGAGYDAVTAGNLSNLGVYFGSSQYNTLARSTANAAKYLNIDNATAAQALGGLGTGRSSANLMRQFGIYTTDPSTGKEVSPTQIFAQLNERIYGGQKVGREQAMRDFRSGSFGAVIKNSGLDDTQQQLARQYIMDAQSGENMDLGNDAVMKRLQKKVGVNPNQSQYDANTSATKTMQAASDAYIAGMQKAAKAIDAFNTAIQKFLGTSVGQGAAQLNGGLYLAGRDQATGGLLAGASSVLGGLGTIGGGLIQNAMLAKTMQSLGIGGKAGGAAGRAPKGASWNKDAGRWQNKKTGKFVSGPKGGPKVSKGGKLLKGGAGALAGDIFSQATQAIMGNSAQAADAGYWAGLAGSFGVGEAIGGAETFGVSGLISAGIYAASNWGGTTKAFGDLFSGRGLGGDGSTVASGPSTDTSGALKLIHPVGRAQVTTKYGQVDSVHSDPHYAIDWGVSIGTPVQAAAAGTVKYTGGSSANTMGTSNRSLGLQVYIDHGKGYTTVYGHLNSISVVTGQEVTAGQIIGTSGNTGYSTGPHLHFELRKDGRKIDPSAALGSNYAAATGSAAPIEGMSSGVSGGTSAGSAGTLGLSTGSNAKSSAQIPASYSGASIGNSAAAATSVSKGSAGAANIGHGASATSTGAATGAGGDASSIGLKGGNNVTINLSIAHATESEARKFAKLIKHYLDEDVLTNNMGRF